jgi:predicted transcriptional regulator
MKTITVNVSEPVYEDFQAFAKRVDRKTSELIREAMELYRQARIQRQTTLRDRQAATVGGPILPLNPENDLLEEMLHDSRD